MKEISITKEMIERRLKNRKIDFDEAVIQQLVKKMGIKEVSDFYKQIADGDIGSGEIYGTSFIIERLCCLVFACG